MQSKHITSQGPSYTRVPSNLTRAQSRTTQAITLPADSYLPMNRLLQTQAMVTCHRTYMSQSNTSFIHFPFNNFRYFLTLFSKFFSSFLHSTCSLSVSRQYLALDEVYHPIRPAFPSKPTLWRELATRGRPSQRRGSNPLWHPVPGTDLYPAPHESAPIDYNSEDFQLELFPVHSPLLGESWLVSFPPLSDMLKFSG